MRGAKQKKAGFTLVEMLIVVAVIAVLVIVAIPIYNAQLEKSRTQVCLNNRQVLLRQLYADTYLNVDERINIFELAEEHIAASQIVCPSGGQISARGDATAFVVVCTEHTGTPVYNLANVLKGAGIGQLKWNRTIDSNGKGEFISAISDILQKNKYNLSGNDINSWIAVRQGEGNNKAFSLYWSEIVMPARDNAGDATAERINTADPATDNIAGIPVIKYNDKNGTYALGYMTVIAKNSNGKLIYAYNVDQLNELSNNGFTQVGDNVDDVSQLRDAYNELLDKYEDKMEALSQEP